MFTFTRRHSTLAAFAAAAMTLPLFCTSAGAGDSVYALPCVSGAVANNDYSELSLNFKDGLWSMRKGVELVAEEGSLTLGVFDLDANSACTDPSSKEAAEDDSGEKLAEATEDAPPINPKSRCNFRSNIGSKFIVRVDNTQGTSAARYRLCPY